MSVKGYKFLIRIGRVRANNIPALERLKRM